MTVHFGQPRHHSLRSGDRKRRIWIRNGQGPLRQIPQTGIVQIDDVLIEQVLANLLSNAIKFTGDKGSISVHVESVGVEVRFSVADTGAGVEPDNLESIFERFWQVTRGDRRGLGLGLFISRCIVEAHGGRIWAESALGRGSTFYFTLPGAAAPSSVDAHRC